MPIKAANKKVKKKLENLTTESWLDADMINKLFKTEKQKKRLSELKSVLEDAAASNEKAAETWAKIGMIKDVAMKLLKKSAGIPI